ncbi:hypothetical protein ACFQ07_20815 [Actinomadura adrarensis]|uniref:Uncharacterized protein n=1 Tax=Actinomadura adrarensis TaxID=1819600 RepID=A0ABW3CJW4_9ACTN
MEIKINSRPEQRFQEDDLVLVWFPPVGADHQRRETWSWLPGVILSQCGHDEWSVLIDVPSLAEPDTSVSNGNAPDHLLYPTCYRDASEIRAVSVSEWDETYRRWADD